MEHICDLLEDGGINLFLGLGVQKPDADAPVAKGKARDTTVGTGTDAFSATFECRRQCGIGGTARLHDLLLGHNLDRSLDLSRMSAMLLHYCSVTHV
jgi:hypothetical protein